MRAEMARQEAQWKEAYDVLLAENNALKSSGSEALLASQWRQRYEACLKEKDSIENKLKMEMQKAETADAGKYEMKYRDLKESFRLYRKKAKEIFEAQQSGQPSVSWFRSG
jgi:predicted phage-related endonuclease